MVKKWLDIRPTGTGTWYMVISSSLCILLSKSTCMCNPMQCQWVTCYMNPVLAQRSAAMLWDRAVNVILVELCSQNVPKVWICSCSWLCLYSDLSSSCKLRVCRESRVSIRKSSVVHFVASFCLLIAHIILLGVDVRSCQFLVRVCILLIPPLRSSSRRLNHNDCVEE